MDDAVSDFSCRLEGGEDAGASELPDWRKKPFFGSEGDGVKTSVVTESSRPW